MNNITVFTLATEILLNIHLAELRECAKLTQTQLTSAMWVEQPAIAGMEKLRQAIKLSSLKRTLKQQVESYTSILKWQMKRILGLVFSLGTIPICHFKPEKTRFYDSNIHHNTGKPARLLKRFYRSLCNYSVLSC